MLSSLKIENVAVIEYSEILFDSGLNILTGETGAGKSIVIDSINAILGERTSRELIRDGADKARVTAYFEDVPRNVLDKLHELDITCDENDNSLLVTRIITSDGRSGCKVNGQSITASMLRTLGRELITICGQHDSQYLLSKEHHIDFIDALADCDELYADYLETYQVLKKVKKQLKKLLDDEDDKERRLEYLKFQIDELSSANLKTGEKESLAEEKKKIQNREKIVKTLSLADMLISGDENSVGATALLSSLAECLDSLSDYGSKFSAYSEQFKDIKYLLEECSAEISGELSDFDDGYSDINSIEERLDTLYRLSRKYGDSEEEMLSYLEKITEEYNAIVSSDELIEQLSAKYDELEKELFKNGCYLSDCRKQTAIEFENKVMEELKFLDIPNARFTVEFREAKANEKGIDEVEFLFSANSGQELKPLVKIASGGELSRVMLAVRCVLAEKDSLGTMIFDEIDTGVSGKAAHKIAYKMHELSKNKQVLCVTHLAQIAAYADNHLYIEKISDENKTFTKVTSLSDTERTREIARIIGGEIITQTTLDSAKELIAYAGNDR